MVHMRDYYIFEIPVYRCTKDSYYADMKEGEARYMDDLFESKGVPRERDPEAYRIYKEHFMTRFGGPWDFNQIVGWIRLYAEGSHVGGHLWWVKERRLQRKMWKTFYLSSYSDILATYFTLNDDSDGILRETLAQLEGRARETPLKGRHVDLSTFCRIGPFINWRGLLDTAAKATAYLPPTTTTSKRRRVLRDPG
jgi:hypothetical protein